MVLWEWDFDSREWAPTRLELDRSVSLGSSASLLLIQSGQCLLLANNGVMVNGTPCPAFSLVTDKDEIRIGDQKYYVAYDPLPPVFTFTDQHQGLWCARCQGELQLGDYGVACESCGALFHQSSQKPCHQYDARCCGCGHPTGGGAWQPEGG